jgi:hypothetical protein
VHALLPEQETNWRTVYTLSHLLTDTLDTGTIDYLTPENTFVTDVHQLPNLAIPVGRRRLAQLPAVRRSSGGSEYMSFVVRMHHEDSLQQCLFCLPFSPLLRMQPALNEARLITSAG